jgi:hypothetical protein
MRPFFGVGHTVYGVRLDKHLAMGWGKVWNSHHVGESRTNNNVVSHNIPEIISYTYPEIRYLKLKNLLRGDSPTSELLDKHSLASAGRRS